ncbi:hypothetical protein [Rhodococcoides navarretei]|uniref:Uncharacterized protein n=1 Tax=Rhodococcus navarretei TaxID=3128981 RepID=A0ABU9CTD7_9NOCA
MSEAIVTELFTFVAARPLQLYTKQDTLVYAMRDPQLENDSGPVELISLAQHLAEPGAAEAAWKELDHRNIEQWAQQRWDLEEKCRVLARDNGSDTVVELDDMLVGARSTYTSAGGRTRSMNSIWRAIYTAFAHGPNAGKMLIEPVAALQLFHLVAGTPQGGTDVGDVLRLLDSRVMLDPAFTDNLRPVPTSPPVPPPNREDRPEPEDDSKYRELARNIVSAAALMSYTADSAVARTSPTTRRRSPTRDEIATGVDEATDITEVSTVASLRSAVTVDLTSTQSNLLDRLRIGQSTPIHVARRELADELDRMSIEAAALDPVRVSNALALAAKDFDVEVVPAPSSLLQQQIEKFVDIDVSIPPLSDRGDADMSGKITTIGIGDLKVVKETLTSYVAGEIAHIENVLAGEKRDRMHRRLDRTETTIFEATDENKESERSQQTTDRFEIKSEAEKTIQEEADWKAGVEVTGSYGMVKVTATGEFATKDSTKESTKNSSTFAREVVSKSLDKVQNRVRAERTTKTITEVEEINSTGIVNTAPGSKNISGIYRWVDKKYRAQVYNYGSRVLIELVLPEPAALYRSAAMNPRTDIGIDPPPPLVYTDMPSPGNHYPALNWNHLTSLNFRRYASRYGLTEIDSPPDEFVVVSVTLKSDGKIMDDDAVIMSADEKFVVPIGYDMVGYEFSMHTVRWDHPNTIVSVNHFTHAIGESNTSKTKLFAEYGNAYPPGVFYAASGERIPVTFSIHDTQTASATVSVICLRRPDHLRAWQMKTFGKIYAQYEIKKRAYDQAVADLRARSDSAVVIRGHNPGINKSTIATELKRLSISMLTGQHFDRFGAVRHYQDEPRIDFDKALTDGRIVQFFEQAFEWNNMTYMFYPYFWGRHSEWDDLMAGDNPDPLFQNFLSAGSVRITLPAPRAFEDMIRYLLMNPHGKHDLSDLVWKGGPLPDLDDDLFRSLAEETRDKTDDLQGAVPEGTPWTYKVPTTLVWLQQDESPLPTAMDQ